MSWRRGSVLLMLVALSAAACQTSPPRTETTAAPSGTFEASTTKPTLDQPDEGTVSSIPSPPPPQAFEPAPRLGDIYFDFDTYDIRTEDARILDENAEWLLANPRTLVLIEGHTDERGSSEYNLGLGDLRAHAAMSYLAAHGVPTARMVAISYGKERPVCTEHDETCWAKNRRAHFLMKPQ